MSIFFGNMTVGNRAGKIKKGLVSIALAICCMAARTADVSAASENEIELKANGSEAELELCFPRGAAEEISSMQISVSVRSSSENVYAEFIPDGGLASKITESRYQSDTGVLNIYLAGNRSLFSDSGLLTVGRVKISAGGNNGASAVVGVVQDSFKFVRGGELISPDGEMGYPPSVNLTTPGYTAPDSTVPDTAVADFPAPDSAAPDSSAPDSAAPNSAAPDSAVPDNTVPHSTASSEQPTANVFGNNSDTYVPSGNAFPVYVSTGGDLGYTAPAGGGNYDYRNDRSYGNADSGVAYEPYNYNTPEPAAQDPIGENLNPPDTSALQDVLSRADSYDQKDYSDNSYGDLNDAVNNANDMLADPNATQDDIDDAMLEVENAIGMLTLRNDIPSGAEGYGANNGEDFDGGYYNSAYGQNAGENGEALPLGQNGDLSGDGDGQKDGNAAQDENAAGLTNSLLFSENGRLSEGGGGILTIGIVSVIAAAAAAVIVIKRPKKENGTDGKHFKN